MKYLLVPIIAFLSIAAQAQETVKWHTDMMQAVDLAIKEKKPLFLFFTGSDWCGWCKRLQKEVFMMPQFQKWAKEKVILVELDFPRMKQLDPKIQQQNMELAQMFEVRGYPSVWFVNASKNGAQVGFEKLGSTGYVAGGADVWLQSANQILQTQQQ